MSSQRYSITQKIRSYIYRNFGIQLPLRQHRPGHIGRNCCIDPGATFTGYTQNIWLDDQVYVGKDAIIDCQHPDSIIRIGKGTSIKPYTVIIAGKGGRVELGEYCTTNPFCVLAGYGALKIGNQVLIATQSVIYSLNHVFSDPTCPIATQGVSAQGITIDNDVWIGAGVRVVDGCHISTGSVIGAGTVVTKDIEPFSVVIGVPGKVVKHRGQFTNRQAAVEC